MVSCHVYPDEIDRWRIQAVNIWVPSACGLYFSEIGNQSFITQLPDQFCYSRNTQVEPFWKFGYRVISVVNEMVYDILFYLNIFGTFVGT